MNIDDEIINELISEDIRNKIKEAIIKTEEALKDVSSEDLEYFMESVKKLISDVGVEDVGIEDFVEDFIVYAASTNLLSK